MRLDIAQSVHRFREVIQIIVSIIALFLIMPSNHTITDVAGFLVSKTSSMIPIVMVAKTPQIIA